MRDFGGHVAGKIESAINTRYLRLGGAKSGSKSLDTTWRLPKEDELMDSGAIGRMEELWPKSSKQTPQKGRVFRTGECDHTYWSFEHPKTEGAVTITNRSRLYPNLRRAKERRHREAIVIQTVSHFCLSRHMRKERDVQAGMATWRKKADELLDQIASPLQMSEWNEDRPQRAREAPREQAALIQTRHN